MSQRFVDAMMTELIAAHEAGTPLPDLADLRADQVALYDRGEWVTLTLTVAGVSASAHFVKAPTPEWEARATMERAALDPLTNLPEMGDEHPAKPFLRESWESHVAAMERAGLDPEFIPTWDRWQHSAWGHGAARWLYRQHRLCTIARDQRPF